MAEPIPLANAHDAEPFLVECVETFFFAIPQNSHNCFNHVQIYSRAECPIS